MSEATDSAPAAPGVKIRLLKDGAASFEVAADTPERAFALLDEVAAGLTARGVLYGMAAADKLAELAVDTAGAVAYARKRPKPRAGKANEAGVFPCP